MAERLTTTAAASVEYVAVQPDADGDTDAVRVVDRRRRGWFWIDNALLEEHAEAIGDSGIAVYCALAMHADRDRRAHPSHERIARLAGLSRRKAIATIELLQRAGLVRIERRFMPNAGGGKRQTSNVYTLQPVATVHTVHTGQCAETSVHRLHTNHTHSRTIPTTTKRNARKHVTGRAGGGGESDALSDAGRAILSTLTDCGANLSTKLRDLARRLAAVDGVTAEGVRASFIALRDKAKSGGARNPVGVALTALSAPNWRPAPAARRREYRVDFGDGPEVVHGE